MTVNHRITDDKEKQRILAIGGKIKDKRLFGQLALSRSFGDCPYRLVSLGGAVHLLGGDQSAPPPVHRPGLGWCVGLCGNRERV